MDIDYDDIKSRSEIFTNKHKHRLIINTPFIERSIISYGLIVYAKQTQTWAVIQRKHSVEFLLYIRGSYKISQLPLLLSKITPEEKDMVLNCLSDINYCKNIFLNVVKMSKNDWEYASLRLTETSHIALLIIMACDVSKNELAWNWPKGRIHISSKRETPMACARREFNEEVEVVLTQPLYISDKYISEILRTSSGRVIEARYWIYIIENEIAMPELHEHPEVSARRWVTTDECYNLINNKSLFSRIKNIIYQIENADVFISTKYGEIKSHGCNLSEYD